MGNPMLNMLNNSAISRQIQPLKQALNAIRASGNPQMMMNQILQQNPKYAQAMQLVRDNGGDPQKAFYSLANQMGVNGDEILNSIK